MSDVAMRAKFQVAEVKEHFDGNATEPVKTGETLAMYAVCRQDGYDATGLDDDNTYARWSPSGSFTVFVANPVLWGKFSQGQKYYLDFTLATDRV